MAEAAVAQDTTQATDTNASTDEAIQQAAKVEPAKEETKPKAETETKPPEQKKPEEIKYALKLPDGSPLEATAVERITQYAKERGLSNEQAQMLLDSESNAVKGYVDAQQKSLKDQADQWISQISTDKELGGEGLQKSVELAKRVVHKYGSPELIQALDSTGLGNHPELVRMCSRIGKQMGEDSLIIPNTTGGSAKKSLEELFYGSPKADSN